MVYLFPLILLFHLIPLQLFRVFFSKAYEHKPSLDEYTTFVVGVKGNTYQFVRATCSRSYIEDLVNRKAPGSPVHVYFSEPFDLLEQNDRREFSKIFIGLLNCMHDLLRKYYDE